MSAIKSRRAILAGAAAIVAAPALASSPSDDPIYPVWREWRTLFEQHWAAIDRLADIENSAPEWASNPQVLVIVGKDFHGTPNGKLHYANSPEHIRYLLGFENTAFAITPQRIARAEALEAELAKAREAAEAEYERNGYNALQAHADALWDQMDPLKKRIGGNLSASPIDIAAKLDLAYASVEDVTRPFWDCSIFYMSCILRGLWPSLPADMQDALRRAAEHDGQVYQLYEGRAQS